MSYDLFDFTESLAVAGVEQTRVEHCSLAFGTSPEGYGSWEGGFVCHARSGKPWIFIFGWCDTTGWGCQDGAWVYEYDVEPSRQALAAAWRKEFNYSELEKAFEPEEFDEAPVDLNRFLVGEINKWGKVRS